jgi:Eco57I restriction-modification methylase/TaqI-like C-terminal specificity domain
MARRNQSVDSHPELGLPEVRKLWQTEGLFSDHYLKARIRSNAWWPTDQETRPFWEFCKTLYDKRYVTCARNNEAFTRQELIDKILHKLGFAWTDNLRLPETEQELEPDYILFGSDSEKESVIDKDAAQRYRAAISLLEAKKVNHPLSQISKRQLRYPHQQIRDYLNEAQVLNWGILTNGNEWRLYCRDAKPSQFFAIDFAESIKSLENFKFFVGLFSPAAFGRDAHSKCRLDYVRESALAAQSELEEDLRQRVFTLVEILANGFAERPENEIAETDLTGLYDASLIFLYRLLFILYAEGRQLLPVEPKSRKYYKQLSLARLVTPLKNFSEYDSRTRTRLYEDIRELCHLINGTEEKKNAEFSVPRYNGGLFDPTRHPLLEKWRVSDAVLAEVLRGLMFNPQPNRDEPSLPTETVDFGDLRVQQLGSIYEGLMEHHFHRDQDTLKLVADKAERRETGTYYTPDYIVKYIVEQTIGPLLAGIENQEGVKKARTARSRDNSFARAALKLNILDPAMGSGHFLVNATTYLAEEIAAHPTTKSLGEKSKDEDEIAHWRRRVVESCIYGVDLNPLAVELAKLSLWLTTIAADQPLDFLDHHLCCGNSLIGARLDDLGHVPELRKKKEGFKFTWKLTDNLRAAMRTAVQTVRQIEERSSDSVDDVKTKERIWLESVRPALRPFRSVANLWMACFFGNDLEQRDYEALLELLDIDPKKIRPWRTPEEFQTIAISAVEKGTLELAGRKFDKNQLKNLCAFLIRAENTARQRRFFHWELEFPEVFFNDDGSSRESPGFDAVIGNPPWGAEFDDAAKHYNRLTFAGAIVRMVDSFMFFVYHAQALTRSAGYESQIVPSSFLLQGDVKRLRRHLLDSSSFTTIVNLGDGVFGPDVTAPCCIFALANQSSDPHKQSVTVADLRKTSVGERPLKRRDDSIYQQIPQSFYLTTHNSAFITKGFEAAPIVNKAQGVGTPLAECINGEIQRGISADYNDAFIVTDADRQRKHLESMICLPVVTGQNIARYALPWTHDYVLYLTRDDSIEKYPQTKAHLQSFREKITCKEVKAGKHPWFALHRERNREIFKAPKIVGLTTTDKLAVALDTEGYLAMDALYVFRLGEKTSVNAHYLIALLNSRLLTFIYRYFAQEEGRVLAQVKADNLYTLPIRRIDFATPAIKRTAQVERTKVLYEKSLATKDMKDAVHLIEGELKAARADVVHDLLAFLAERMMAMNQEKRTTAKQFLTDLKDFHDIDARALNPKTKLDEFWRLEALDLFAHLRKNARRLEEQNVRLSEKDEDKIRSRFVTAKEALLPLEAQITFTDQLIDQIVYRLYGLTPEEIKIVEGASTKGSV